MPIRFILLLGGTGFIGSHLLARLSAEGYRVTVVTREFRRAAALAVNPAVDNIVEADIHDDQALQRLVANADAVINLVGILHSRAGQPFGPDFRRVHVDLPRRIVHACALAGGKRYLHMSALGAAENAPSAYLRSRAAGEREAFATRHVATTAFRPSVVFGPGDHLLTLFARLQKFAPLLPLAMPQALFQPVYVGDVAEAFARALARDHTAGQVFELGGPQRATLRELVQLAGRYSGHERLVIGLPDSLARLQAWVFEHLPGEPLLSRDNLASMSVPSVTDKDGLGALGIRPTPLDAVVPDYLGKN